MKTYGVNWFLVWMGLLILFCPIYLWAENVLLLPWPHFVARSQPPILVQALGQSICWSIFYYYIYGKTLADPKAVERVRQSFQRSAAARYRRHRWVLTWAVIFALTGITSAISRLIFGLPSWLQVVGYSLFVPCSCLAAVWLIDEAAKRGQLAQLMKDVQDGSRTSD